jgi:PEP-CTERM motif.
MPTAVKVSPHLLVALGCAAISFQQASAVTVVNDGFEPATHPGGFRSVAVAPGVPFIQPDTGTGTASLVTDDNMGNPVGNKALSVISTSTATSHVLTANLGGTISLANVSDTMTLSFKIRLTNTPTSTNGGFRFGLYGTNGTVGLTEGSGLGNPNNDTGYYASLGTNNSVPAANNFLFSESGGTSPILAGLDRASINSAAGISLNDALFHTLSLTVTRATSTTMSVSFSFDGGTAIAGTTTVLYTSFDEIAISDGFQAIPTTYNIDDVLLTASNFTPVPEPAVAGLAGFGLLALLKRRRA